MNTIRQALHSVPHVLLLCIGGQPDRRVSHGILETIVPRITTSSSYLRLVDTQLESGPQREAEHEGMLTTSVTVDVIRARHVSEDGNGGPS